MPKGSGLTKPLKLSAALADIVGKKEASTAECIKKIWTYVKNNNLQDPENKQFCKNLELFFRKNMFMII